MSQNRELTEYDFQFREGFNTPGVLTELAEVEVPFGEVWLLDPTRLVQLFTTPRQVAQIVNDATTEQTIDLDAAIVDNPLLRPMDGGVVMAYTRINGVVTRTDVTSVNFKDRTVTVAKPASTDGEIILYYLLGEGQLQVQVRPPVGSTTVSSVVLNRRIRSLNQSNPYSFEEAPRLDKLAVLPPEFRVVIMVNAPVQIRVDDDPVSAINDISSWRIPYRTAARSQFQADLEQRALAAIVSGNR